MKFSRNHIIFFGSVVAFVPIPLLAIIDYKLAIIWFTFVCLGAAYAIYRRNIGEELVVALLFALVVTSYKASVYTGSNLLLGHINIYPLFVWTAGLVALREIYKHLRLPYRWVIASAIYILALFILEYVGYYLLGIKIPVDSPSLFGIGIIHGSPFIHLFYLIAGPLYLLVADYLRVS